MYKKIGFLVALFLPFSGFGFCDWCYRGIDVDIGVGASSYSPYSSNTEMRQRQYSNTNVAAQVGVGVNAEWGCWIFGVRGFGQYNNAVVNESVQTATGIERELKMPWDAGVDGRLGYAWNECMHFFGTVGADWGWNQIKETDFEIAGNTSSNNKKVHVGLRVGGGGEQWLTRCIFIRETFAYTWFQKKTYLESDGALSRVSPRLASTLFTIGMQF